ncbi:MAG: ankyrin repeat domain-containing protein [Vicinamibacterales bacterium]
MSSDWGPPGLETPTSYSGVVRLAAAAVCLVVVIGIPWCHENVGWIDVMTGRRGCGAAPSEIRVWSVNRHTRRPEEIAHLEQWVARHPYHVNKQYGASCDTALHFAARFGREDLAEMLIAAGAAVEAPNEFDDRPLHAAATYGRSTVVKVLLARGADVHARGSGGNTPLLAAASGFGDDADGLLEVAKLLLAAGADVNASAGGGGFTALRHVAVSARPGNKALAELLLSYGADPGGGGSQGPPLVGVASAGNLEGIQLLLDGGADANAASIDTTALGVAAYRGHPDAIRLLVARGAEVDRRVRGSRLDWEGLPLAMGLVIARTREDDRDVMNRRREAARALLDRGADANARNSAGETLLHRTASEGDVAALDLLLSHRGQPSARDAAGSTPLHAAVRQRRMDAAARLLAAGASPRARASDGTTPLDLASGDPDMTALLRRGAKN